jgi:ABC-type multidrug transport system ATPase subunit
VDTTEVNTPATSDAVRVSTAVKRSPQKRCIAGALLHGGRRLQLEKFRDAASRVPPTPTPAFARTMSAPAADAGPQLPTFPVTFTQLDVTLPLSEQQSARGLPTVGGVLAAAALSLPRALGRLGSSAPPAPAKTISVLSRSSSTLLPGRLTLLLGHPGSGKSTLLKALTHRLAPPASTHLLGEVAYGGLTAPALRARGLHLCHLAPYVSQLDEHFPFLTVRETLQFAADSLVAAEGGASGADTARARVDATLAALHLTAAAGTLIGNDLVRGVSGGEKKRVTIGEGLLTGARFLALDEISTGLDSSTTFEVVSRLRERAVASRAVVIVALLQPTPEVYSLFDDVMLQREGAIVFHGPRDALPGYLRGLGFFPPRAGGEEGGGGDEADWLAEFLTFPAARHKKHVERVRSA